jgi:phenylalanyl-tRNA synthetase beta chain
MINNLSEELNVMRPSMLETGLETIAHNLNRRNHNIRFFEFGKTYSTDGIGSYAENNHLCLFATGTKTEAGWNNKAQKADFYFVKGIVEKLAALAGLLINEFVITTNEKLATAIEVKVRNEMVGIIGEVNKKTADKFDCKQPVFFADINWDKLMQLNKKNSISFKEIPKFPAVQRDLAIVVDKSIAYQQIEKTTLAAKLSKLKNVSLFDIFESEKLGANKKSMAVSFTFLDEEKTMTDSEIDAMMNKIIGAYEKELNAEIRK